MKTLHALLLATLLAAAPLAQADTWYLDNDAGGRIVLTTRPCPLPDTKPLLEVYTYNAAGGRQSGCWAIFDDLVQVSWGSGKRSVFPIENFTVGTKDKPAPVRNSRQL
jgi:hypothetical protein